MKDFLFLVFISMMILLCGCSNKWTYTPWWVNDPGIGTIEEKE